MKAAAILAFLATPALAQPPVHVVLDMDAATPGIQNAVTIPARTSTLRGVAVYIYDPAGTRSIRGIGYLGGLDRGLAVGHQPSNRHIGSITALTGHLGTPLIPGSPHYLTGLVEKGFTGPELHYIQTGGESTTLPAAPLTPVFTLDVHLAGAAAGDVYTLALLDMVSVWRGEGGAFTAQPGNGLETGGDAVPDGTQTALGLDPDLPAPVPPAAFLVDYIDGLQGWGGARILVSCFANCDGSSGAPILTANDFQCFLNKFASGDPYANCDGSTGTPILTANDFQCFLNQFAIGCQ